MPWSVDPADLKFYALIIWTAANALLTIKGLKQSLNGIGGKLNAQVIEVFNTHLAAVALEVDPDRRRWLAGFFKRGMK